MYQRIAHNSIEIEIQEHFRSPMVYLDHWALNDISSNRELRERFIKVMNEKAGTFRLSVANMTELSKQADKSQVDSIIDMIRSIDDCGLINIDPGEVIRKENALILNRSSIFFLGNPSAEMDIVAEHLREHHYPDKWHVADIITSVIGELPSKRLSKSNQRFLQDMKKLIAIGRKDVRHIERATSRFKKLRVDGPKYQRATREITQMALDFVLRNKNLQMSEYSEWVDLFHVIVPVSYCDVVLIDRRWKAFISQTGYSYPKIAMIFDKRSLNDFYQTIETWR
jgi:hypothetical protein